MGCEIEGIAMFGCWDRAKKLHTKQGKVGKFMVVSMRIVMVEDFFCILPNKY